LMMRLAQSMLNVTNDETVIIGDRMDTDIIAGIETGIDTVLVLTGVTKRRDLNKFPYGPMYILPGVGNIAGYRHRRQQTEQAFFKEF